MTNRLHTRYGELLPGRVDKSHFRIDAFSREIIGWMCVAVIGALCLPHVFTGDFLARAPVADRGLFIAAGKLIAEGGVLYRDVYDNKTPGIYLLSALGWWLSPDSRSVFLVERCAIVLLVGSLFAMLRYGFGFRVLPSVAGLIVGLIWFRNPEIFAGGHVTEEYGILFQAAAIAFLGLGLHRMQHERSPRFWAFSAGLAGCLMLLMRQSFLMSLVVLWAAIHLPFTRSGRGLLRLILWELIGFAVPIAIWLTYLWRLDGLASFFEIVPDSVALAAQPGKGSLTARVTQSLVVLERKTLQNNVRVEVACALIALATLAIAQWRQSIRGTLALRIPPMSILLWFVAELVAASLPAEYYNHQYIPFAPIAASIAAVLGQLLIPQSLSFSAATAAGTLSCFALLASLITVLDGRYHAEPLKYWFVFAPNARLPAQILQTVTDDAHAHGWRTLHAPEYLSDRCPVRYAPTTSESVYRPVPISISGAGFPAR